MTVTKERLEAGFRSIMPKAPVVKTSPIIEIIGKCLFGINSVPNNYRIRMVNRACKEAHLFYADLLNKLKCCGNCANSRCGTYCTCDHAEKGSCIIDKNLPLWEMQE